VTSENGLRDGLGASTPERFGADRVAARELGAGELGVVPGRTGEVISGGSLPLVCLGRR